MSAPGTPGLSRRATRPRVAVVYPTPFGEDGIFGGGERYAVELARALAGRTPTRLVTFGRRARRESLGDLEVRVVKPWGYARGARQNPVSLTFLAHLADADVVHCVVWNTLATDLAVAFARLCGKPSFVTDVGGGASVTLHRLLPVARWVDTFLLISPEGGEGVIADPDRCRTLLAGIDIRRYSPPGEDAARSGVLYVGRIVPHKGIDVLIRAVAPETPLTVVGRPYHAEYYELLQRLALGKRVTFVTDADDEQVVAHYRAAAVAMLPSVNRTVYGDETGLPELLGFTALEAMACATPVVVTRVGGMARVVVDGETGYLVGSGDADALGDRLARLLADPGHARRLGRAARRRIEEVFTWDRVAERCLAAYEERA